MRSRRGHAAWIAAAVGGLAALSLTLACLLGAGSAAAQMTPDDIALTVDADSITVGDIFTITLSVNHPEDHHVIFPDVPAEWGEFEALETRPVPTILNGDGTLTSALEIDAVLFERGTHATPALSVAVRRPDGNVINYPARPIEVVVETTLAQGANALSDIKPQAEVPVPGMSAGELGGVAGLTTLTVVGAVGGLTALSMVGALFWRRNMAPRLLRQAFTPLERALESLDRIERQDLPASASYTEHYTLIANCLRTFLLRQFRISASTLTTERLAVVLDRTPVSPTNARDLVDILTEADLVKFAGLLPDAGEARDAVERSREVVTELAATPSRFRPRDGYATSEREYAR